MNSTTDLSRGASTLIYSYALTRTKTCPDVPRTSPHGELRVTIRELQNHDPMQMRLIFINSWSWWSSCSMSMLIRVIWYVNNHGEKRWKKRDLTHKNIFYLITHSRMLYQPQPDTTYSRALLHKTCAASIGLKCTFSWTCVRLLTE